MDDIRYIRPFHTALRDAGDKRIATLLWGDPVRITGQPQAGIIAVIAREREGFVKEDELCDKRLLEVYVIDVGQGDAVLLRTPDGAFHLVDAGVSNDAKMTRKGAVNFVRWKFQYELKQGAEAVVSLATVIVTHADADHYSGMINVLSGRLSNKGEAAFKVEVERFFHAGIGRFHDAPRIGAGTEGDAVGIPGNAHGLAPHDSFITELFEDKQSFREPARALDPRFAQYAALVGSVPTEVKRISHRDQWLPGYGAGEPVAIRVLGPVLEQVGDVHGLRRLASESKTQNGHSVVLRVDYGKARILLGGDLNEESQRLLRAYHDPAELAADVLKACHHGSRDFDPEFLQAVGARATIVSSGDNEGYAHPQPVFMGAAGRYGRELVSDRGKRMPPLVYSTELSRSIKLENVGELKVDDKATDLRTAWVRAKGGSSKRREDENRFRPLAQTPIPVNLIYGLVNVRTDGQHILCATMKENGNDFDVQVFRAGE